MTAGVRRRVVAPVLRPQPHVTETAPLLSESEVIGPFEEGTIRIPVRGEEAVVRKEAFVTGELVVNKERTVTREEVTETVRRQDVELVGETGEL